MLHRHRKGGSGGLQPPQYFSGGGRAPPNILGLILNYKLLPKVLKGFAHSPAPPIFMPLICLCVVESTVTNFLPQIQQSSSLSSHIMRK